MDEVSVHEVTILGTLKAAARWLTSAQIAAAAHVPQRTVRHHMAHLVDLGVVEAALAYPAHSFRLVADPATANPAYWTQAMRVAEVVQQERTEKSDDDRGA